MGRKPTNCAGLRGWSSLKSAEGHTNERFLPRANAERKEPNSRPKSLQVRICGGGAVARATLAHPDSEPKEPDLPNRIQLFFIRLVHTLPLQIIEVWVPTETNEYGPPIEIECRCWIPKAYTTCSRTRKLPSVAYGILASTAGHVYKGRAAWVEYTDMSRICSSSRGLTDIG